MNTSRKLVSTTFKLNGLTLRSDGLKYLCTLLEPIPESKHSHWIDKIIEVIQSLPLSSSFISQEEIKKAADVLHSEVDDVTTLFRVINVFDIPRWRYNVEKKKFFLVKEAVPSLFGEAADKAALFRNRYTIVYQRTVNHELFVSSTSGLAGNDKKSFDLVKIEYLLGLSSKESNLVLLGLLTQMVEGKYHLEDDTGSVQVDLSEAKFHAGLFTQNCFVLVEGWFEDGVMHVTTVGLPPPENSDTTRALFGNANYFGGPGNTCAKYCQRLQEAEENADEAMIVFLSDLWLDKIQVMKKVKDLLRGYAFSPPTAFVFCGNFLSTPQGPTQFSDLKSAFDSLADLICDVPELSTSKFVFVPGPNDPGPGNIYPRPPLPSSIRDEFEQRVPNSVFASNPCRLLFCTQEIVVFREDIFTKMCRNAVHFPADASSVPSHFARTLVSEAHLSPMPLHVLPVFWALDHCLSLHPTPDLIVTADRGDSFTASYNSCTVINPGSFMKNDFSFKVYLPATKRIEDSEIQDET